MHASGEREFARGFLVKKEGTVLWNAWDSGAGKVLPQLLFVHKG